MAILLSMHTVFGLRVSGRTHPMHSLVGMSKASQLSRLGSLIHTSIMLCIVLSRPYFSPFVPDEQT